MESTKYRGQRKKQLIQLHDSFSLSNTTPDVFDRKYTRIKGFIKNEAYGTYKAPRLILSRSDLFKILVGPTIKRIENIVYHLKSPKGRLYFIKTIPSNERANYIRRTFDLGAGFTDRPKEKLRRYLVTDFKAFESGFSKEFMENCEFLLYEHMVKFLPHCDEFLRYLRVILGRNFIRLRFSTFRITARRMSGEMNTSLGNGFSNLMLILYACFSHGITDVEVCVEGDDSLCSYVGPIIDGQFWSSFGFSIKLIYHHYPSYASFCGQVFNFETLTIIPDPIKILLNLTWMNMKYCNRKPIVHAGLLRARALSILYQYSGCPIVQELAVYALRVSEHAPIYEDDTLDSFHKQVFHEARCSILPVRIISPVDRALMFQLYGISPTEQIEVEKYLKSLTRLQPLSIPILKKYCNADQVHYYYNYVVDLD